VVPPFFWNKKHLVEVIIPLIDSCAFLADINYPMITEEAGLGLLCAPSILLGPFKRPVPQGFHCSLLAIDTCCLFTTPRSTILIIVKVIHILFYILLSVKFAIILTKSGTQHTSLSMEDSSMKRIAALVAVALVFSVSFVFAQAAKPTPVKAQTVAAPEPDIAGANGEVVDLVKNGNKESVILAFVRGYDGVFDTSRKAVIALVNAGVPDVVIDAMEARKNPPTAAKPMVNEPSAILKAGTEVKVKILQKLTSLDDKKKGTKEGDRVEYILLDNVVVDGRTILRKGSRAIGSVTEVLHQHGKTPGKLTFDVGSVATSNGQIVPLTGDFSAEGGLGRVWADDAEVKEGTEFVAKVESDWGSSVTGSPVSVASAGNSRQSEDLPSTAEKPAPATLVTNKPVPPVAYTGPSALTPQQIDEAIKWGMEGKPELYLVLKNDGWKESFAKSNSNVRTFTGPREVAAFTTPFLRVALAARNAKENYKEYRAVNVKPELTSPTLQMVMFQLQDVVSGGLVNGTSIQRVPIAPTQVVVLPKDSKDPSRVTRPLNLRRDIQSYMWMGTSMSRVAVIATFPIGVFSKENEFVMIYEQDLGLSGNGREIRIKGPCLSRGENGGGCREGDKKDPIFRQ